MMIILNGRPTIACYEFSQEIGEVYKKEDCVGRACFTQSGTYISFSAAICLNENGKSIDFENVQFVPIDFGWPQAEAFYRALLELRCFMALENHLAKSGIEQLLELGKKLSSLHIDHGPWHFWNELEIRDLDYLTQQLKLLTAPKD